jgi:multiple sugar transport system substrate-binding protein
MSHDHTNGAHALSRRSLLKKGGALAALLAGGALLSGTSAIAQSATVRWSTIAFGPEALALWQQIADRAEAELPGTTIEVEGTAFGDYWTKLQTQLASGGSADLLQMQSLRFPGYASRGVLLPLNDMIAADPDVDVEDFYPSIRSAFEQDGQLLIMPFDLGTYVTYLNVELFEAAGVPLPDPNVPMTWAQLAETAAKLTDASKGVYGMVLGTALDAFLPWIWSNGGEVVSEDMKTAGIGSEKSVAAIQFLLDLMFEQKVVQPVTDVANANFAPEAFVGGKVAMYFDGPWRFVSIKQNAKFKWDVVPFPAGEAGSVTWVAGSGWGISAASKNPEAAWKVLKELTSTQSLKVLDDAGRVFPSRQSTFALRSAEGVVPANAGIVDKILKGEIGEARPLIAPPTWNEMNLVAQQLLAPLLIEPADVAGEMAVLQSEMQTLLDR